MGAADRPAAEGITPGHFPAAITPTGHVEPCPRRIRAVRDGQVLLDTTRARYRWTHPYYPRYEVPFADVHLDRLPAGERPVPDADGMVHLPWGAAEIWMEEDEQVFLHPRSPYVRVDALRSSGRLAIHLDGALLAEATTWVTVFETGLPPRRYLDRTAVRWSHLEPSATRTECPYKGRTTGYWHVRTPSGLHTDVAWAYDFPTRALTPVAGLVAFLDEAVEVAVGS